MSAIQRYTYKVGGTLGGQDVCNLSYLQVPFISSILVDVVSGSCNYAVEFTTDDISGDPSKFRWNPLTGLPPGQSATVQYTLNYPCTAVRLNIAASTGEIRFTVIQATGTLL